LTLSNTTQQRYSNSLANQRQRLLNYLKQNRSITTLEARHKLDIMHPSGRIKELKEDGYYIVTNWRIDTTPEGKTHRVAEYILMPKNTLSGNGGISHE
jgi:hypothetical protein